MTEYDLTRRDALKALAAAGITVAGGAAALSWEGRSGNEGNDETAFGEHERATYRAVARVVYPSDVSGVAEFVDSYLAGRTDAAPDRAAEMADAVAALDAYSQEWETDDFRALNSKTQAETLSGMGVKIADPDPDGEPRHRVRYYLVNDLLYALYRSPTGGELVGIENPQGYPGGTTSYQQPPGGE